MRNFVADANGKKKKENVFRNKTEETLMEGLGVSHIT